MAEAAKINVGIIGGAGYTGGEMARILLNHPGVDIKFIHSRSNEGLAVAGIHKDLEGDTDLTFSGGKIVNDIDVAFLCLGHNESDNFLQVNNFKKKVKVIDLSQDFRLGKTVHEKSFVYGLPELNKEKIKTAHNIANPGCFATAITLGLLPLAKNGLLSDIYTTGITGSTGAGQTLSETSHFSWRANNVQAYKTLQHQHLAEIQQSLSALQPQTKAELHFVPWRGNFTRGIFCSSQVKSSLSLDQLETIYREFYNDAPFVHLSKSAISLKQVVNTNKALIQLEKNGDNLVIHTAIDNLLKGASGQAVQNMNIMFGLDETMGLKFKANAF